jgi:hypothetical protein
MGGHPMNYYGVIGNRDYIKIAGEKLPYWDFLDEQPDGWLSSLTYKRRDLPSDTPLIMDCGAWSYKNKEVPPVDAESVIPQYLELAHPGAMLIAPDHMLIDGADMQWRRRWNQEQARRFIDVCPKDYKPMACIHGETIDERLEHAEELVQLGYKYLAVGGVAARASQRKLVLATVAALREVTRGVWLHVLGLSSPSFVREWKRLGVESCDGSSHFKQAFTGGAFFTVEGDKLTKHQAVRPGEDPAHLPACDCRACQRLADDGVDTRSYGSNEHNMGRAAHNQNMLMRAHKVAMRLRIGLVACCGQKLKGSHRAADIYQSALFKKSRAWAEKNCDTWAILSAKHGVLWPDDVVENYDVTLNDMPADKREAWSKMVRDQLARFSEDRFAVLAGKRYCEWTEGFDVERPMAGMGIGQQLQWLTEEVSTDDRGQRILL